jgi:hypothetical protein
MAGDLNVIERVLIDGAAPAPAAAAALSRDALGAESGAVPIHRYGRVLILAETGPDARSAGAPDAAAAAPDARADFSAVEEMGLAAFKLRASSEYRTAKARRPRSGEAWDMPRCTTAAPAPEFAAMSVGARSAGPTSAYLEGSVAVGIVIVEGPTPELRFTDAERIKVVAEVQNGLGFLATANPLAGISFSYDIQDVVLDVPANSGAPDLEALWRNPAMAALGFSANWTGVSAYVEDIRARFGTRWTFCVFFTKYPLFHFAYASIGGPRVVMDYHNDGWGPDNIDRVFAHETGHIFGAPDEYGASGCNCGGSWGRFGLANHNCANCAAEGGVPCLMKANTFALCGYTAGHLGWSPQLVVRNFGRDAGGWQVDRHPRFMADTTGDGLADIVGFGNAGVWRSRAIGEGRFKTPELVVPNFGYDAGGWRVDQHPRFVVDTTGDGRADVIGFGNAGVWRSRAQADGSYAAPELVVNNFGRDAGGWRVDQHPRMLADTQASGRLDIVGFGNAGVWISRSRPDGGYDPPVLVVNGFGRDAGGWRVDRHPRFMADTTGDGRADIVGFGDGGVWVSRAQPDGTYGAPQLVVGNFGYNAGGWRVELHPRFVVDTTGDGRADIVGFGNAGVWRSRANADGTFGQPEFLLGSFGLAAGGWRVDRHPRFLVDTTGDGRLDIVGFGDAGVWVSRALAGGGYEAPGMVIPGFGYVGGGWRVDQHPRFVADVTGEGRADIIGFGNAGVWYHRS